MLVPSSTPARRRVPRVVVPGDVWVYWEGHPHCDISRIRDLSSSGLFLETRLRKAQGDLLRLHFLVEEGQIRVEGDVMHSCAGKGLGLRLHSLTPKDLPQFDALLSRLRTCTTPMRPDIP